MLFKLTITYTSEYCHFLEEFLTIAAVLTTTTATDILSTLTTTTITLQLEKRSDLLCVFLLSFDSFSFLLTLEVAWRIWTRDWKWTLQVKGKLVLLVVDAAAIWQIWFVDSEIVTSYHFKVGLLKSSFATCHFSMFSMRCLAFLSLHISLSKPT